MKPFEEQFTAWIDGKLSGPELAEFEKELAAHPESAVEKEGALRLGELLREHSMAPAFAHPDFFNHQLLQRIAAETPRPVERKPRASFLALPWLAWAGAGCLLVSLGLYKTIVSPQHVEPSKYFAQVVETWPSDPSISATTVYSPEDNVTVVWLDGLEYIPATYALK